MGKRRNRQPDVSEENAGESTESCEDTSTGAKSCPHIAKAIDLSKVKKALKVTGIAKECAECVKAGGPIVLDDEEAYEPLIPILWICLKCGSQGCGRGQRQHALQHFKTPRSDCHCLTLDTHRWSLWCYECENEVSADSRKKLLELVEFVKKQANSAVPLPTPPLPVIELEYNVNRSSKEAKDLDNKKKTTIPMNLSRVKGLTNLGNTCFLNAVMQCLAQTPYLVKVLKDLRVPGQKFVLPGGKFKPSANAEEVELPEIEGTLDGWGTITSILHETLTDMQSSEGSDVYTPSLLLKAIASRLPQFSGGDQHDSHELLRHLLELVQKEDLRRYQSIILNQVGLSGKTNPQGVEENLKSRIKFYGNQACARLLGPERVFRGVLVSTLECLECHHSSHRTEPFLDLSLPVMADKPQPPILKRKNSGLEDTFDLMGNNTTNVPSKHQLKKERLAAMKHRRNRRNNLANGDSLPNQNSITEENQEKKSESESDADVEDNIESEAVSRPEVGESGYSSEKPSTMTSPMSPGGSMPANNQNDDIVATNDLSTGSSITLPSSADNSTDSSNLKYNDYINTQQTPSPTIDLIPLNYPAESSSSEIINTAVTESPASPDKENPSGTSNWPITSLSLNNSLTVNSDLTSPEGPTVSPLSTSITSKDSPTSPASSAFQSSCMDKIERPMSSLDVIRPETEERKESSPSKSTSDLDANIYQKPQKRTGMKKDRTNGNGVDDVISGLSRLGMHSNGYQSPSRYPSEDGECSVQSCLNQFTALELMSGNNKVGCEACTERENKGKQGKMVCCPSTKQYLISKAPAVLILHLKRFQMQRVVFRKVTKHVAFPPMLDLAPVCRGYSGPRLYALYGVVEHSGTLHGGHYVAYVKSRQPLGPNDPRWSFLPDKDTQDTDDGSANINSNDSEGEEAAAIFPSTCEPPPGRWYFVSDSRYEILVMEVDETRVLQSQAYLLFYERIL
ncbi:ubiquitin carboxyl-terminal hydrolase 16 isoform X2 [Neodiprion virginianus]|uniref:ubiquitin carboxyl-terminal hydrolase 16 isoform X2 n=1 Tax=Neodiprion virginianus TaxID=2961670 RepID=UPI001EE7254A|nr:ubiquitin carboxyl-terminal hydrolase 16 isoform X2 [Neodiprion virginianus]